MNPYAALCDDFGIFGYLNSKLDLPAGPDTVVHFFEALQKSMPELTQFDRRESGEFVLEEERDEGSFRSVTLEGRRLASAHMNPAELADADRQHERVLEIAPYHLDISPLKCDSLDVVLTFDFLYKGNHHEVVAEALAQDSPFEGFLQMPGSRVTSFEPAMMVALDESARLQARVWVESRTSNYELRTGQYNEAPITVYFLVHQDWGKNPHKDYVTAYRHQRQLAQELVDNHVLPGILLPLHQTISIK
jgi:hypothetical protein